MDNNIDRDEIEKIEEKAEEIAETPEEVNTEAKNEANAPYFNHLTGTTPEKEKNDQIPEYTVRPEYKTERPSGTGNISYTPAPVKPEKKKKEKHGIGAAGITVLVLIGLVFAAVCGFAGSYVANRYFNDDKDSAIKTTVVYKDTEHPVESSDGSTKTYSDIHSEVCDSVVSITTEYQTVGFWQYITSGAGSGVVMAEDGYIITNSHVIVNESTGAYADKITVELYDGTKYDAEVIGSDADADIAVIKVDATGLKPAVIANSDDLVVGEEVLAVGNPLGTLSGTMTNGIISALARKITVEDKQMNLLQTNAAINPGNSGGGLFNMNGALVGIVNAKSSGTGIEGLGFAIPVNDAIEKATEIIETEGKIKTSKTVIGITTVNVDSIEAARKAGVNAYGVYVWDVLEGYNDSILKKGDRIIAVEEKEITKGEDVSKIVKMHEPGDEIEIVLYRDGKIMTVNVKCFESEETEK